MFHQAIFTNDSIPAADGGCNFQMGHGSVRAAVLPPRPVSLQALGRALRQVGPRVQAQAFGAQGPALRAVWAALPGTGLAMGLPTAVPSAWPQSLLLLVVQAAAGALLVVVGAGSGKTQTLATRLAWLEHERDMQTHAPRTQHPNSSAPAPSRPALSGSSAAQSTRW